MMTDQVAGYIAYFSGHGRGVFERAYARSGRYHDMMVSTLKRITGIDQDAFTIHPDNTQADVLIAYGQVLKIRKNPGPIGWMLVGAILAIVIIVATR